MKKQEIQELLNSIDLIVKQRGTCSSLFSNSPQRCVSFIILIFEKSLLTARRPQPSSRRKRLLPRLFGKAETDEDRAVDAGHRGGR